MKKVLLILLCIGVFILVFSPSIYAEEQIIESIINKQLDLNNSEEIDRLLQELMAENEIYLGKDVKDIVLKLLRGEQILENKNVMKSIKKIFINELSISLTLLSKVLIITIMSAILTNLQNSFEESSISQFANYFAYMTIAILIITNFSQIMKTTQLSVNRMINFMQILLPILLTLMVLTGGPSSRMIFHPIILGSVNIMGTIIKNIIFPLIYFSFILNILSNLSNRTELSKLSELGRKIIIFIISAVFTIFIGILTIYGLSTKMDGLTIRTAKFAIDSFLPIVGGFLSDSIDAVIGSSAILKNGIGIVGLIILVMIILIPLIKITVLLLIYSITAAIIEPIASKNIVEFFGNTSKTLLLILISMVAIGIMFFITITVVVDTSNNLLMLR
ncbi:MAG TPA: stage III sporulation protein AE [Tissierellaceae bacterium]|nr:stage III sporulation protein AE [Tissierellaceae bacterium]